MIAIREAVAADEDAVWVILEPVIRAGDVFALPVDMDREDALAYWFAECHWVFVAEDHGVVIGSYYLRANQRGGGSHVCNCGYATADWAQGRGVAAAMCTHSLEFGKTIGFRAMQFNLVIDTNTRAKHLWQSCGFDIVGRLPGAFEHPTKGFVDALIMFQTL